MAEVPQGEQAPSLAVPAVKVSVPKAKQRESARPSPGVYDQRNGFDAVLRQ